MCVSLCVCSLVYLQGFVVSILLITHGTREWFLSSMSVDVSCKINNDINYICACVLSYISKDLLLLSCCNNKKRENLEYYFITCIFPNVKLKSGFRISCSVKRKLKNLLPLP